MRHIVVDRNDSSIYWRCGDTFEVHAGNMDMFIVRSVPEEKKGECVGCFGRHKLGDDDFCLYMPNGCGATESIFKPACGVSSTMLALSVLEEREDD